MFMTGETHGLSGLALGVGPPEPVEIIGVEAFPSKAKSRPSSPSSFSCCFSYLLACGFFTEL